MLLNADSERYERFVLSVLTATSTRIHEYLSTIQKGIYQYAYDDNRQVF